MSALAGVRVIDLTSHNAGPYCTMILADLGADVIKVERPEIGDETRGMPPFVNGEGAPFMQVNRNKRSTVLEFKITRWQGGMPQLDRQGRSPG